MSGSPMFTAHPVVDGNMATLRLLDAFRVDREPRRVRDAASF